jgi:hypothetical protein
MPRLGWLKGTGPWWGPYLGVLLCAAAAGLLVLLFVLLNAAEIIQVLRGAGG